MLKKRSYNPKFNVNVKQYPTTVIACVTSAWVPSSLVHFFHLSSFTMFLCQPWFPLTRACPSLTLLLWISMMLTFSSSSFPHPIAMNCYNVSILQFVVDNSQCNASWYSLGVYLNCTDNIIFQLIVSTYNCFYIKLFPHTFNWFDIPLFLHIIILMQFHISCSDSETCKEKTKMVLQLQQHSRNQLQLGTRG